MKTPQYKKEELLGLLQRVDHHIIFDSILYDYLDQNEWDDVTSAENDEEVKNHPEISDEDKKLWLKLSLHGAEVI